MKETVKVTVKESMLKALVVVGFLFSMSACLKTREALKEQEQAQEMQTQVVSLQKQNASQGSRFDEINDQVRAVSGRVEVLESKVDGVDKNRESDRIKEEKSKTELHEKLTLFQQELEKMQMTQESLQKELADLKAAQLQKVTPAGGEAGGKELYEKAEILFKEKSWKEAILTYQKYKDKVPKGKHAAEATYKTAVCFQELGMKDEAKAFYSEVISKYAGSDQVKKARQRLKSLK